MIRINLIPTKASRKKEGVILQLVVAGVVIGLAFVVAFFVKQNMQKKIEAENVEIGDLKRQIDDLQSVIKEVENYKKKKKDLEVKIQTIRDLNEKRSGPVRLLQEVGEILPTKLWITTFKETEKNLTLEGVASDATAISDLVDNLKKSKFFHNVQLITINQAEEQGKKVQKFSITCMVNYLVRGVS